MFETVLERPKGAATRGMKALPAAVMVHLALAAALLLAALLAPIHLEPPPFRLTGVIIPVTLASVGSAKAPAERPAIRKPATEPHGLTAPTEVPKGLSKGRPASEETPAEAGPGIPGGVPVELLGQGGPPATAQPQAPKILPAWAVTAPHLVRQVTPAYPEAARAMGLTGKVLLQIVVNQEGRVVSVEVMQASNPIFVDSAVAAVRQWQYSHPIDAGGQSVACYVTVLVSFAME
ncbi:MAG: TonB family protein [Acidobacteriota bacterium]